jgi:nitrous-oxide reductase
MTCIRSKFIPEAIEVHQGDHIKLHLTNVETVRDMTHGLALPGHGINIAVDPGQTVETTFVAGKPGTYWYYCTWFCSALHLEMRGRLVVKPEGAPINEDPNALPPAGDEFASEKASGASGFE